MSKPTSYPDWMTAAQPAADLIEPGNTKKAAGWASAEPPPYQFFNWFYWVVSEWIRYFDTFSSYDVVVKATGRSTHATLAAAVADSAVGTNVRVLLADSQTLAATVNLTKAGWRITALPGVTYTAGVATTAFSMQADGISVERLRFSGFTNAVLAAAQWTYGRVLNCNFLTCTNEVDDTLAPAGKKPALYGNITE